MRSTRWIAAAAVFSTIALPRRGAHDGAFGDAWWMGRTTRAGTGEPAEPVENLKIVGSISRTKGDSSTTALRLAFSGERAFAGHYEGFQIVDASHPENPEAGRRLRLPGLAARRVRVADLLFVSVEAPRFGPGLRLDADGRRHARLRGHADLRRVRSGQARPRQGRADGLRLATHTLVPDAENGRVLLYVASYTASELPESPYGNECRRSTRRHPRAPEDLGRRGPGGNAAAAKVVSEPAFPQNDRGGVPGYNGCHDITVFTAIKRAASACMGEGQIWDISDKEQPRTIARIHNLERGVLPLRGVLLGRQGRSSSATRPAGARAPRCRPEDPDTLGALWFYDVRKAGQHGRHVPGAVAELVEGAPRPGPGRARSDPGE